MTTFPRFLREVLVVISLPAVFLACLPTAVFGQVSVIGDLSQDREASPGTAYDGVILVKNDTEQLQEAKVYQTDYSFHFTGTNNYGEPGTHPRSNAAWIRYSPSFLSIPPNATIAVNFTVVVPKDTTGALQGTYWSMLMVEGIARGSAESVVPEPGKQEMGIAQTIRYGIQVATTVAGTGRLSVQFIETKLLRREEGGHVLQVDLGNDGERVMRPEVYAEVFSGAGQSFGKFEGIRYRMYPGTSVRQMIPLSGIAPGTYTVLVVVDAGGDEAFAAQYTLQL